MFPKYVRAGIPTSSTSKNGTFVTEMGVLLPLRLFDLYSSLKLTSSATFSNSCIQCNCAFRLLSYCFLAISFDSCFMFHFEVGRSENIHQIKVKRLLHGFLRKFVRVPSFFMRKAHLSCLYPPELKKQHIDSPRHLLPTLPEN